MDLLGNLGVAQLEEEQPSEEWMKICTEIRDTHLFDLEDKLKQLRILQGDVLLVTFDDVETIKKEGISSDIRKLHQSLKRIAQLPTQQKQVRDNIVAHLLKKLQTILTNFTQIQNSHLMKLDKRQQLVEGKSYIETYLLKHGKESLLQQSANTGEQDIQNIIKDVLELQKLFQDFSLLVDQQDRHVLVSMVNVEEGTDELRVARIYQKNSRTTTCIILLCLLLTIGVFIFIVKMV